MTLRVFVSPVELSMHFGAPAADVHVRATPLPTEEEKPATEELDTLRVTGVKGSLEEVEP